MMAPDKHLDEARQAAVKAICELVAGNEGEGIEKAVLLDDLFGRIRLVIWPAPAADEKALRARLDATLQQAAGERLWTGDIWVRHPKIGKADQLVYDRAWTEGKPVDGSDNVRLADQHRSRAAWFDRPREPLWKLASGEHADAGDTDSSGEAPVVGVGPPVVAFYSFKGGVGRTTALAAFTLQRAREHGERVVVIDFDLDAPGAGALLAADDRGTMAPWGVVDYLLERPHGGVSLSDYYHRCSRERIAGSGSIHVFPAGRLDDDYLTKLARVDLDPPPNGTHPFEELLNEVRTGLQPDWILVDVRAGLSPAAGLLLNGFAHLHVLFGTTSEQSWLGMRRVLHHIGAERLQRGMAQADCLLVQAMVPDNSVTAEIARHAFAARALDEFIDHYYAEARENPEDDAEWSVDDIDSTEAPHVPSPLSYTGQLAFFRDLEEIADKLVQSDDYVTFGARIAGRFGKGDD